VVKPNGAVAAGPLNGKEGTPYAEIDAEELRRPGHSFAVCSEALFLFYRPLTIRPAAFPRLI
jgi:hypothetical protein